MIFRFKLQILVKAICLFHLWLSEKKTSSVSAVEIETEL